MEDGTLDERLNPWGPAMFRTLHGVTLETPVEESGYDRWLEQTSTRQLARQDRIHGAAGVMPTPLWIALFFISLIVLGFILTFADSGERAVVQGLYMGGTLATIMAMLLLLQLPRRSRPAGRRRAPTEGHGAGAGDHGRGARRDRRRGHASLRRGRAPAAMTAPLPPTASARDRVEIVATVLLSVAAVATAWSSYQAARWNGEQAKTASRVNATRVEAARAQGLAEAQTEVDVATFIQWVDASANDDVELKDFYEERFRDEFKPAFEAWLATDPLVTADAPPTPFAMPEYKLEAGETRPRSSTRGPRRWRRRSATTSSGRPTTCSA